MARIVVGQIGNFRAGLGKIRNESTPTTEKYYKKIISYAESAKSAYNEIVRYS